VKPSHPYLFHTPTYYIYICYNEQLLQPPIQRPKWPQWQTKSKFLMSSFILILILCSVNYTHLSNTLLLQYLSNDNSNDANDVNNIRFRRQQRDHLVGESLYPIQFRNDQHVALNQTQHFSQPHQLLTDSNSTYSNEVNLGVSNHNEVITRHCLENHLGSDRSHRQSEIEQSFARNRSKYRSQSFEMESDSRPSVLNPSYQQSVHHRVRPSPQHLHQRHGEQLDVHRQSQDEFSSASAQSRIHPSINDQSAKNRAHRRGKGRHSLHIDRDQYAMNKVSIVLSNSYYQF